MRRKINITFLLVLCASGMFAQQVKISRVKSVYLLHKLDSFILRYQEYSSKSADSLAALNFQTGLLPFYDKPGTLIFDDINPNLQKRREVWIVEKEKKASQYLRDADSTYTTLKCKITWTNLGNASQRMYYANNEFYIPVTIRKELKGYTQGNHSACYATKSKLNLLIHVKDTDNFPLTISAITKTDPASTQWEYIAPAIRQRRVEMLFSVQSSATYLFKSLSFKDMDAKLENIVYNDEIEAVNNRVVIGYGATAELAFRFILGRSTYRNWGLYMGTGIGAYNVQITSDKLSCIDFEKDIDNDYFYRISNIRNLKENCMFYTCEVPFQLSFEKWRARNPYKGRYLRYGARFSCFPYTEYKTNQQYSQAGYYPEYNLFLTDIDEYHFYSDKKLRNEYGTFNTSRYNVATEIAFGKMRRSRGGHSIFYYGLNVTNYVENFFTSSANSELFTADGQYKGILSKIKEGHMIYCGFTIGIKRANKDEVLLLPKKIKYLYK
jgi:hypothetical protein